MEDNSSRNKNKFIFVGLGLQVFALVFGYLCLTYIPFIGWLPAFYLSPIIFLIGIVFIFFSRIRLIYKFILGFWIIIVPLGIITEKYYQRQLIQNEIYLIPQNYHGSVVINFGEPVGTAPDAENKAVVFKVNSSGTLKTNHLEKTLRQDLEAEQENFRNYYYVDESGNRTKLKVSIGPPERNSESTEVLVILEGYYFSSDGKNVTKLEFFVGTPSEFFENFKKKYP